MMQKPIATGTRKKLGEILLEGAFVTPEQLQKGLEAARTSGRKLGEVLVEQNALTIETLATVLSFQLNIPIIELRQFKVNADILKLIPENIAREHNVLPLSVDGSVLRVAMEDPTDLELIDTLTALTRMTIQPAFPLRGGLREIVNSSYRLTARITEEAAQVPGLAPVEARPAARGLAEPLIEPSAIAQAPLVRAVDMIITQAVRDRASDIHIIPTAENLKIKYRIDGALHDAVSLPLGVHQALISRIKVLSNMNIAERRRPQDGQFALRVGERDIDFRVATVDTKHGEMVVLRVLDKSTSLLSLDQLGLQPGPLQLYLRLLESPFGMIMVSGPTGSGKTTTLYGSLNKVMGRGQNIMTIEDPVEYQVEGVNQIQVNRAADITFPVGLRAIMRLDPDIILVGEIRDQETANTAVQAALTGHLVLTTIHANDAAGALVRLVDMGVEPFLVTSGVIASVTQRLVRRICPYCRQLGPVSPPEAMAYQQEMGEVRTDFYSGRGCNFCSHTGYLGRVGVYEVMPVSDNVRTLVNKGATSQEIKEQAIKEGMITLRRDGMLKAKDGITTVSEVIRSVHTIV
ncbi:MAG: type II/IV secretion system protein [Chloroflexi bacterium]|nr:type II/IV secretion system protein [Chloroflexota bacterium]